MSKKKSVPWQIRQGDVALERVVSPVKTEGLKEVPREEGGVVLAHGEVTGHKHQIRESGVCELRNESTSMRILAVEVSGLLVHEEHVPPIQVGAGQYEVLQQCEWDWVSEAARAVAD